MKILTRRRWAHVCVAAQHDLYRLHQPGASRRLARRGVDVRLYFIAYNAALAWNMLEDVPENARNHCMIACWGRDYRYSLAEAPDAWSERFHRAFSRWSALCRERQRNLAVFEYYGDHWMMSTLLPPLAQVIRRDMQYMRQLGIYRFLQRGNLLLEQWLLWRQHQPVCKP